MPEAMSAEAAARFEVIRNRHLGQALERAREDAEAAARRLLAVSAAPSSTPVDATRRRLSTATAVILELRNRRGERTIRWMPLVMGCGPELRATVVEGPSRLLAFAAGAPPPGPGEQSRELVFDFTAFVGLVGAPLFRERGLERS